MTVEVWTGRAIYKSILIVRRTAKAKPHACNHGDIRGKHGPFLSLATQLSKSIGRCGVVLKILPHDLVCHGRRAASCTFWNLSWRPRLSGHKPEHLHLCTKMYP